MMGVVQTNRAIQIAAERGLDLVEVSPNAEPPVCKILDFGKYKFEQQRKRSSNKKKQRIVHIKEIKLRPTIDQHDYEVKLKSIDKFLKAGDKVKISLRFRGREITHKEIGMDLMQRMITDTQNLGKIESPPKMEGKQIIMIIGPKNS